MQTDVYLAFNVTVGMVGTSRHGNKYSAYYGEDPVSLGAEVILENTKPFSDKEREMLDKLFKGSSVHFVLSGTHTRIIYNSLHSKDKEEK